MKGLTGMPSCSCRLSMTFLLFSSMAWESSAGIRPTVSGGAAKDEVAEIRPRQSASGRKREVRRFMMLLSVGGPARWRAPDGLGRMTDRIRTYCDRFIIDIIRRLTITY